MPNNLASLAFLTSFWILISQSTTFAQSDSAQISSDRLKVAALPLTFFTPDTKWGFGASGLFTFNQSKKTNQVTLALIYTQLNQFLFYAPFQFYTRDQKAWVFGELGYYDYIYNYFGVGNGNPANLLETYNAQFPRLDINWLKRFGLSHFLGIKYHYDRIRLEPNQADGELASGAISGSAGGRQSGLGLVYVYDNRANLFFPTQGWLVRSSYYFESHTTGSMYSFGQWIFNAAKYIGFGNQHVLANNLILTFSHGDIPFYNQPFLGGTNVLRGYFQRRFLDQHMVVWQSEYRGPLMGRLGWNLFVGVGQVFNSESLDHWSTRWRYSYGAGLRFTIDRAQHINIRLDYGIGHRSSGFYATVNEAF